MYEDIMLFWKAYQLSARIFNCAYEKQHVPVLILAYLLFKIHIQNSVSFIHDLIKVNSIKYAA